KWTKSISNYIDTYIIYSDYGTGTINWNAPIAYVSGEQDYWLSNSFGHNKLIKFVIRALRKDGILSDTIEVSGCAKFIGDFNSDGVLDIQDLVNFAKYFGKTPGDISDWDKYKLDENYTNKIDNGDLQIFIERMKKLYKK
ncbi:MAG TPA: hypothetical protein PLD27_11695, partial [bacterium]|nr:hypothetical protein [bacterium]